MKKSLLNAIEEKITVIGLILYSGAILTLFTSGGMSEGEGDGPPPENILIKSIFFVFYAISFGLLATRWQKTIYAISKNIYVLLFTGLAILSISWSIGPSLTTTRSFALFGTNLFGLYLGSRYTLKQQLMLLAQAFGMILFLSMVTIILLPKYGIMAGYHPGAWRGVFNHKNVLGKWMVLSTVVFFLRSISESQKNKLTYLGLIFSVFLIIMSKSSSALINVLIVMLLFLVFKTWRWRYEIMVPVTIVFVLLGGGFFLWFNDNSALLYSSLGKDAHLSGRTDLWALSVGMGLRKPWFGYGYGAFWENPFSPAAAEVWRGIGWIAPNAHNGFIDLFLNFGSIGLFIIILSFINTFVRSFIYLRYGKTSYEFWPLLFMAYLTLANLTESGLIIQNDIFTVCYVAISYSIVISTNSKARSRLYGDID